MSGKNGKTEIVERLEIAERLKRLRREEKLKGLERLKTLGKNKEKMSCLRTSLNYSTLAFRFL